MYSNNNTRFRNAGPAGNPIFSNLTAMRGIAALFVVVFHFEILLVMFLPPSQSMFFRKCYLMVDLFFIMSGFIIFHVYGQEFSKKTDRSSVKKYMIARFARIYPLHFFALMMTIALVLVLHQPLTGIYDPKAIPTNLLLLNSFGLHPTFTWNVPSWSLSAECFAYLLFPLVAIFINNNKRIAQGIIFLLIILFYELLIFYVSKRHGNVGPYNLDISFDYGWLRGTAGFLMGMLVYSLYAENIFANFLKKDIFFLILCILIIAGLHFAVTDILLIPLFACIVLCAAHNEGFVKIFFANRLLQWLGTISYSLYLMQGTMTRILIIAMTAAGIAYAGPHSLHLPQAQAIYCCIFYLISLVGLASITYLFIENPARKKINESLQNRSFFIGTSRQSAPVEGA